MFLLALFMGARFYWVPGWVPNYWDGINVDCGPVGTAIVRRVQMSITDRLKLS